MADTLSLNSTPEPATRELQCNTPFASSCTCKITCARLFPLANQIAHGPSPPVGDDVRSRSPPSPRREQSVPPVDSNANETQGTLAERAATKILSFVSFPSVKTQFLSGSPSSP